MVILTSLLIPTLLATLTKITQKHFKQRKYKWNHFECGFNPITFSSLPFSFQFFLISLLFLIFDIEIALVLRYPIETQTTKNTLLLATILLILTTGLMYEWQKRKIEWTKWMGKILCKSLLFTTSTVND